MASQFGEEAELSRAVLSLNVLTHWPFHDLLPNTARILFSIHHIFLTRKLFPPFFLPIQILLSYGQGPLYINKRSDLAWAFLCELKQMAFPSLRFPLYEVEVTTVFTLTGQTDVNKTEQTEPHTWCITTKGITKYSKWLMLWHSKRTMQKEARKARQWWAGRKRRWPGWFKQVLTGVGQALRTENLTGGRVMNKRTECWGGKMVQQLLLNWLHLRSLFCYC